MQGSSRCVGYIGNQVGGLPEADLGPIGPALSLHTSRSRVKEQPDPGPGVLRAEGRWSRADGDKLHKLI